MLKVWREKLFKCSPSTSFEFLKRIEERPLQHYESWAPTDLVTVAVLAWPEIITSSFKGQVVIKTCDLNPGLVRFNATDDGNVMIVKKYNVEKLKMLLKHLVMKRVKKS